MITAAVSYVHELFGEEPSHDLASQPRRDDTITDANGVVHVGSSTLILSALPLLCIAFIGHRLDLGLENTLIVGIIRSYVQLMILGWILHPIFVMGMGWPWLVGLYVLFMILIATKESISRQKYTYQYHYLMTFLAFFVAITFVGAFAFLFIVRPEPRWNPQYVIPICGMLMGNCINGVSLISNNLSTQITEAGKREIELYLSFGASGWKSMGRLVKGAVDAGVTPMLNTLNVIGLVSIPGMMTGQILGGSPVREAAHYQILIMYLIATCTFSIIFINVLILYRVAFDSGTHILRTDRFIEVAKTKNNIQCGSIAESTDRGIRKRYSAGIECVKASFRCIGLRRGQQDDTYGDTLNVEIQPLSSTNSNNLLQSNRIHILTRELEGDRSNTTRTPLFRIAKLQFSVPMGHLEKQLQPQLQQQRVLCTDLNASLNEGEIGIVRGPSGCGKSTLLRVLSGLSPMDHGDAIMPELSLADCYVQNANETMLQWRTLVRYVTQYKVDIPGTPRDFIHQIALFCSNNFHEDVEVGAPSQDEMISQTILYLQHWDMNEVNSNGDYHHSSLSDEEQHPYLDKEWKQLSGGESQRTILAIAMSSRPRVLLMDEATSGLDVKTEKCVEKSVVDYVKKHQAAVLWVTHSEDIAERLLTQ